MRVVQKQQLQLGELAIADIDIDLKSRDDIPKIMLGLQFLHTKLSCLRLRTPRRM